jgi:outer membrane protein OmpA-like peptidoglycan-associated protein
VNWRHIKALTLHDALLSAQLQRFETDKTLQFMILGYSDSAGPERNNVFLRTGRARNVFHLLGPSARSRTAVVKPATPNEYFTENSTVESRAQNRSVVIHILARLRTHNQ